jgi:hypothetical protein
MEREDEALTGARLRTHPHPIHFAGAAGWALFVALVVTLMVRHNDLSAATEWSFVAWGLVVALVGFVGPMARWLRTWVEFDGPAARCTSGVLRQSTVDVDLVRSRAMEVDRGFAGGWLGYGRLRVLDDGGATHLFPPVGEAALRAAAARRERRGRSRRGDRRDG